MSISKPFIEKLLIVEPKKVDCYISNPNDSDEFIEQLKEIDETLLGVSVYQNLRENISNINQTFQTALLWIAGAFAITALITIYAFSKISVIERRYEVAVLRSLGMKKTGVFAILNADIIIIIIASFVLSLLISALFTLFFPKLFADLSMLNLVYPLNYILAIIPIMLVVGCGCASSQSIKCLKSRISDMLRQKT